MKSDSQIEQMHHLRNRSSRAKRTVSLLAGLVGLLAVSAQTVVSTTQTSTGPGFPGELNLNRQRHTATLLFDGKVLVAGGDHGFGELVLAPTELYDSATGKWSATRGDPLSERIDHTATLLPDGKVLVAGGWCCFGGNVGSSELFDPNTGTWSETGGLNMPRLAHSAIMLPNGKVLVAGGTTGTVELSASELYDPDTGTWTTTGNLNTPRLAHSAILLPNGKVLVAGGFVDDGFGGFGTTNSAELYDPDTGTWSFTGNLNTPRLAHSAILLPNGRVLVAGGCVDDGGATDSAELYDPDTATWNATGSLNSPGRGPAILLSSGKVLVVGGDAAELYNPETETWSLTAGLNAPRRSHTATLLPEGRVLVAGGRSTSLAGTLNSSELYDPGTQTWIGPTVPAINDASIVGKKLFVFGENFGPGAVLLRNGIALPTKDSGGTNTTELVATKKAGKKTKPGDRLRVLNRSGALSREFVFGGS